MQFPRLLRSPSSFLFTETLTDNSLHLASISTLCFNLVFIHLISSSYHKTCQNYTVDLVKHSLEVSKNRILLPIFTSKLSLIEAHNVSPVTFPSILQAIHLRHCKKTAVQIWLRQVVVQASQACPWSKAIEQHNPQRVG